MRAPSPVTKCSKEETGASSDTAPNTFSDGPFDAIFAKTALPIIFVMRVQGGDKVGHWSAGILTVRTE